MSTSGSTKKISKIFVATFYPKLTKYLLFCSPYILIAQDIYITLKNKLRNTNKKNTRIKRKNINLNPATQSKTFL